MKKTKILIPLVLLISLPSCSNKKYGTLILDANGGLFSDGTVAKEIKGVSGRKLVFEESETEYIPTKENAMIKGWYENKEATGSSSELIFPYLLSYRLYAGWANKVNITYYVGADVFTEATGYQGMPLTLESVETDDKFFGWYYDKEFNDKCNLYEFPEKNLELYAKIEENPTIYLNYDSSDIITYTARAGSQITETFKVPSMEGYKFIGWYTSEGSQFFFDYMPGVSLELYPKFLKKVNISFESNGGTTVDSISGYETEPITTKIPYVVKDNYYLEGWYTDSEFNERFKFEVFPSNDLVLYAKWILNPRLSFSYEVDIGATKYEDLFLAANTLIPELPSPIVEGYRFLGWYTYDGTDYDLFQSKFMPSNDVNLIGRFEKLRRVTIETVYKDEILDSTPQLLLFDTIDGEWWGENYSIPNGYVLEGIYLDEVKKENLIHLPYNPTSDVLIKVNVAKKTNIDIYDGDTKLLTISGGEGMSYNINDYKSVLVREGFMIEGFYLDKEFTNVQPIKTFPSSIINGEERLTLTVYIRYIPNA